MNKNGAGRLGNRLIAISVYLVILIAGLRFSYYKMFAAFSPFDDEGSLMHLVQMYLENTASYDLLRTVYGPLYFLQKYAIYTALNVDVSHDITRLTTIGYWAVIALVGAVFVHRITKSLLLAAVVQMQLILHLADLIGSPGHPQEIATLVIMSALLISSYLGLNRPGYCSAAGLGVAVGCLILIKINLGVYLGVPLALSMLLFLPRSIYVRGLFWLAALSGTILPIMIMWKNVQAPSVDQNFCIVVVCVIAACLFASSKQKDKVELSWRAVQVAIGAFVFSIAVISFLIVGLGGSFAAIMDAVVLRALGFPSMLHTSVGMGSLSVIASAISLLLAMCYRFSIPKYPSSNSRLLVQSIAKLVYGFIVIYCVYRFSQWSLFLVIPAQFMWVVLIDTGGEKTATLSYQFPRIFLCLLAAFQLLLAYPVAGAQLSWASILLIPLAAICIGDACPILWEEVRGRLLRSTSSDWRQKIQPISLTLLLCAVCLIYYQKADIAGLEKRYSLLYRLDLPGASKMRMRKHEAVNIRRLVKDIKSNCDGFVGLPGFSSLYFWTQLPPPGNITGAWIIAMEDERQREIIRVMDRYERPCVVHNRRALKTWAQGRLDYLEEPLVEYITRNFREVRRYGSYSLHIGK
jgi:hypothetical protein